MPTVVDAEHGARRHLILALVTLVGLLAGVAPAPAQTTSQPPDLFTAVSATTVDGDGARTRLITTTVDLAREAGPLRVRLNLFDDLAPTVTLHRSSLAGGGVAWTGSVEDAPDRTVQVVIGGGFVAGNAWLGADGSFTMAGDGTLQVTEAVATLTAAGDLRLLPPGVGTPTPTVDPQGPRRAFDGGPVIDILVVLTDDVLAARFGGNTTAANVWAQARITEFNTALANSQAITRGNLAGTIVVTYGETGDLGQTLDRLTATADGYLDSVHASRDALGADVVAMVVNVGGDAVGIAWLNCSPGDLCTDTHLFSVSEYEAANGFFTMSHEIGHNLGIRHDAANDPGADTYARGYRVPGEFATIVAYTCDPGAGCPGYAPRRQYYSNPDVLYAGTPMGIPIGSPGEADAVSHVDAVASTVASARAVDWQPVGLVDPSQGQWHLRQGAWSTSFYFGNPGDFPFVGDWDCNGTDTPGLYRQTDGYVYLRNSNTVGIADITFFFGNPGDIPIAGDFDNDGCDTVSIYRPSEGRFYIINELGQNGGGLGAAEFDYYFGNVGDKPFVGDFDGNGTDTVGLHRESTGLVYFRNSHTQGIADNQFLFGNPNDRLIAGDWNNNGTDSPAVYRPGTTTFYYRYTNTQGIADEQATWGSSTWLPISGNWTLTN